MHNATEKHMANDRRQTRLNEIKERLMGTAYFAEKLVFALELLNGIIDSISMLQTTDTQSSVHS